MKPAAAPPAGLPGLDPSWSRLIEVDDVTWHLLERPSAGPPAVTVLAVHGNPTWSYLWRRLLAEAPATWRVIAVDQIGMGYSQRPEGRRSLADRIQDLCALTDALDVQGPVVTVAHDWGGPVSLGWAFAHRDQVVGTVLTNTAVHQPSGASAPGLIRLARWEPLREVFTAHTPVFTRGTTALSAVRGRPLPRSVSAAFAAPYRSREDRRAVADFVADIPLEPEHPSATTLDAIATDLREWDVPTLLAWGADDPVFSDRYLRDLLDRLPHADVHRYERAGHLVTEEAPSAITDIIQWIDDLLTADSRGDALSKSETSTGRSGRNLQVQRRDDGPAVVDMARSGSPSGRVTWTQLADRVDDLTVGLVDAGVRPGDRIALLIPPGADLVAVVYACWSVGAAVIVADRGLGPSGMRRAIRGAAPDHIIAIAPGLALTRGTDVPGQHILVGAASSLARRALGATATLTDIARRGRAKRAAEGVVPLRDDDPEREVLIAFTSGSTGPAKGVRYTRARVAALVDAIAQAYRIDPAKDGLVAAFAPWVVLGPALGIPSSIPDMDITDPGTLTCASFTAAARAVNGTIAWTSPTGIRALVDTAPDTTDRPESLRLLMVAGAPTPVSVLEAAGRILPDTRIATPYGMTEALPLTDVDLPTLSTAGSGDGVLVGTPIAGVEIRIDALDALGHPMGVTEVEPDTTGEILVRASWTKHAYDRRWGVERRTADQGWHRTGDVGHLDEHGRLWVEGRLAHVITTARGPVTPVAAEEAAAEAAGTPLAACVGIGPRGRQVVVIVLPGGGRRLELADLDTTDAVRRAVGDRCGVDVAAVLRVDELPVDVRHRSKLDRAALSRAAGRLLAGSAARRSRGDGAAHV